MIERRSLAPLVAVLSLAVVIVATAGLAAASSGYDAAVIASGPLSYWELGESSGSVAVDAMGLHNGTYVGGPTLGVSGLIAGDGATGVGVSPGKYVDLGSSTDYNLTAGTVVVWFSTSSPGSGDRHLFTKGLAYSLLLTDGTFRSYSWGSPAGYIGSVSGTNNGAAHMAALTWAASSANLYTDGSASVTGAGWNAGDFAHALELGAVSDYGTGTGITATLQKAAIWNRALSAGEISALYAEGVSAATPTPVPSGTAAPTATPAPSATAGASGVQHVIVDSFAGGAQDDVRLLEFSLVFVGGAATFLLAWLAVQGMRR